jgi:hypothetical protein
VFKKKDKLLFFLILAFFLTINGSSVFALEISDFPVIPGLRAPSEDSLPSYIAYFFGLIAYLSAIIAVISFAIGGIQLIMSPANPSLAKEAKEKIKNSLIGIILTLSAVVILQTINPSIIEVQMTELPETDGIFYTNGSNFKPAPMSELNVSNISRGYRNIIYKCQTGTPILIWKYPKTNFRGNDGLYKDVTVVKKKCGERESLSGVGSFKISYESPGIYFCLDGCNGDMCSGFMSQPIISSNVLFEPFKDNLGGVRIVNDLSSKSRYGIIFHNKEDPTSAGNCYNPIYTEQEIKCFDSFPNFSLASATVFYWNYNDYQTSGQGVNLYSEPFGWGVGARAGEISLKSQTIGSNWSEFADSLIFNYSGIERPIGYKQIYENFKQRSGSIEFEGSYIVVLWVGSSCQVFKKDVVNLKTTELLAPGAKIERIFVAPTN